MLIYQNLAYCRYLQIWALCNLLNLIKSNPNISLILISFLHTYNINFSSKRIFILLQDYILIYSIFYKIKNERMREKNFNLTNSSTSNDNIFNHNIFNDNYKILDLYFKENAIFFLIYIKILILFDVNPLKLHTKYLPKDDLNYKNENFIKYFIRIWYLFIFDKILFNKFDNKKYKKYKKYKKNLQLSFYK
tara:strand:+ start:918 stop:1490 length:573 start_codon:yes stop_codon:yes gene_type:complete